MKIPIRQLESERLILRSFNQSDLEPLLHYRSDPGVAKYQLWQPFTREMALDFIIKYKSPGSFVPEKWFGIAIALKKSNALIGDFAVKIVGKDYSQAEIGFNLSPKFQKQGYATEAVLCILDYLFKELKYLDRDAVIEITFDLINNNYEYSFSEIETETLVLTGDKDENVPKEHSEYLAKKLGGRSPPLIFLPSLYLNADHPSNGSNLAWKNRKYSGS